MPLAAVTAPENVLQPGAYVKVPSKLSSIASAVIVPAGALLDRLVVRLVETLIPIGIQPSQEVIVRAHMYTKLDRRSSVPIPWLRGDLQCAPSRPISPGRV